MMTKSIVALLLVGLAFLVMSGYFDAVIVGNYLTVIAGLLISNMVLWAALLKNL